MRTIKTHRLVIIGLVFGFGAGPAGASSLEEGLIAWWRMELREGDQEGDIIPDTSGNGHHLTIHGSPSFEGCIVIFDDDGFLEADDSDALDLMDDWTIAFWVREDSNDHSPYQNPTNMWMTKTPAYHDEEGGWAVASGPSPDNVRATIYGSSNHNFVADRALFIGSWILFTATFDDVNNTMRVYLNGSQPGDVAADFTMLNNPYQLALGGAIEQDLSVWPYCKGAMGDVRIYSRVLSDSEIGELFQMGPPAGQCPPETSCPADFDADGDVDAADLADLLGDWGECVE